MSNKENISIIEAGYEVIKKLENKIEDLENEVETLDSEVRRYQGRIKDLEERIKGMKDMGLVSKFSSEVEEQQKNLDQIDLWAMEIQELIKKIRGKI